MSTIGRWLRRRMHHLWIIARYDSTAFAELASGLLLILLRGLLLIFAPRFFWPFEVAVTLYPMGLNESTWGSIFLMLGLAQLLLAGSSHHLMRLLILIGIITTFVIVGVAYTHAGYVFSQTVLSITCLTSFEAAILVRVFHDRRSPNASSAD